MYVIFLVLIIDLLGFTVILPLMPSIFEYYDANEKDHLYHWMESKVQYFQTLFGSPVSFNKVLFSGFIGSVFSALQFLVAPIFGSLSDVYGRKTVMILSMVGIGVSHAIWCMADYFYLFVIARIIGGLSRANISLSTAIVTDLCSERKRSKGMALIGIAFGIGFIVGPIIGAVFASRGVKVTPRGQKSIICWTRIIRSLSVHQSLSLFSFNPVINIKPEEKRALKKIGLIYFLFLFIYSGLEYSLSFLTHMRFNFTSMQQGKMYLFSGLIMIFIQGGYVRRIPPGKETKSAAIGALLIIPAFILIGISNSIGVLYVGLALYAYASATVVPCLTTIASKFGSTSQKGTVLGIFRSLGSLARAFGPLVFAVAYWSLTPTVSYCIGGLLLIVPLLLILNLSKELPQLVVKED
ncbi:major facilitator superfamily domain-containing protein 10 [Trichonephila clavata]|uniref:Major facilitator superfamily domain-containing protein 10 n=1 Tax=Trichonephila clavata TaxID=2740835 RepID=A0A8X6HSS5_TRICU|nr:major facilitator superfamily domain-containing protein 10 [Trichonephila clavata]